MPRRAPGDYTADESAEDRGGNPARLVASDEGLGDAEHTERGQGEADEVDVSEDAAAFANLPGGQDGDVPTGTLSQKTHCQTRPSTMAPPMSGPAATATPVIAPQAPSALPRIAGGVASMINASASGTAMPPPMPCRARAAMRRAMVGLSAHNADATVNTAKPAMNMRRRPYLSPSVDPVRMEAAKASAYALTVQLSLDSGAEFLVQGWQRRRHDESVEPYQNEANEPRTRVQRCAVRDTSGAVLIAGITDLPTGR